MMKSKNYMVAAALLMLPVILTSCTKTATCDTDIQPAAPEKAPLQASKPAEVNGGKSSEAAPARPTELIDARKPAEVNGGKSSEAAPARPTKLIDARKPAEVKSCPRSVSAQEPAKQQSLPCSGKQAEAENRSEMVPGSRTAAEPEVKPVEVKESLPVLPCTHLVRTADNLWKLSVHYYGRGSQWKTIFNANKDKIKNADRLEPGMVLTIPALSSK